ncbi:MAG: lamin tail domain-containing protein, partial [Phycisphaerales bacterium JB065]
DVPGEFTEIYNTGNNPVDISGWYLADEDGNFLTVGLPDGTFIEPGEAIIIMRSGRNCATDDNGINQPFPNDDLEDPELTAEDFYAGYGELNAAGEPYRVIVLANCLVPSLANTASPTNEVLTLVDNLGNEIDAANYENGTNGWPATTSAISIYLKPQFLNASDNDTGAAWTLSVLGVNGAGGFDGVESRIVEYVSPEGVITSIISGGDIASPGYVETEAVFTDCNNNSQDDALDIFFGFSNDCNYNNIPDECEPDCNNNGTPDDCDIAANPDLDCNNNGQIDSCEIAANPALDSNNNGILDECEAAGNVIITEIMFDPSTSPELEYIELYNTSSEAVDISGWTVYDLEGDPASAPVPAGTILGAGEIIVLFDAEEFYDATKDTFDAAGALAQWQSIWGSDFNAIPLPVWGARANFGTPTDEILAIVNENGVIIDVVNYNGANSNGQTQNGWPGNEGHASIYLVGTALDGVLNNNGQNWRLTFPGLDNGRQSNYVPDAPVVSNTGEDFGSPGFINFGTPESPTGNVVITEIMSTDNCFAPGGDPDDPNVGRGYAEWVEIYNRSSTTVDISGWYLQDEDGYTSPLPEGSQLAAGEVAVIYGMNTDFFNCPNEAVQEFYDAWGCGYQVFPVEGFYANSGPYGLNALANGPSQTNEVLRLVDANGVPSDIANYDDDFLIWPLDGTGMLGDEAWSIFVIPPTSNYTQIRNDDGQRWGASFNGLAEGRIANQTFIFNSLVPMYGSPGALQSVQTPNLTDCQPLEPCPDSDCADVTGDGNIDLADLNLVLANFGSTTDQGDADDSGTVDLADLNLILANFGTSCE